MIKRILAFGATTLLLLASAAQAQGPSIREVTSAGGIKAWLIEDHKLPLISIRFAFRGGVEADPQNKQGIATLATTLLTQGAGPYEATAFQDRLASHAIQLEVAAGRDELSGQLKTLRRSRDEAFRLLSLALTQPRFGLQDIERERERQKASIRFQIASPEWQARYALYRTVFGDHPYAYRSLGTPETLDRLKRDDLVSFVRARMAKDNLVVSVVGDISSAELALVLDRVFGALPDRSIPLSLKPVVWPVHGVSVRIPRTGEQTNVFWASPMINRDNPSWEAAEVANYILGGGSFESRLMRAVRAQEGLTYGVGTTLAPTEYGSMLVGHMATDNAKAADAVSLVRSVWARLVQAGASKEEVAAAKEYLKGSWPLALSSTDAIAAALVEVQSKKLGMDYFEKRNAKIDRVTQEDVNRILVSTFDPSRASFSFVGQPEGVAAEVTFQEIKE